MLITQSCPTLCDPMNCSPPGSSVHGILQVRILEQVAIPFSRGSSQPRDQTPGVLYCRQILYSLSHQGTPKTEGTGLNQAATGGHPTGSEGGVTEKAATLRQERWVEWGVGQVFQAP